MNIIFKRNCPECSKIIEHKSEWHKNRAENKKVLCKSCANKGERNGFFGKIHSKKTKNKLSKISKDIYMSKTQEEQKEINNRLPCNNGADNGMYGKNFYKRWVEKYGQEIADIKMQEYRKNKSIKNSGENNPMYGKPSPQGSGNGWKGWFKGYFFRSLKELSFLLFLEKEKLEWTTGERKNTKIQYTDWNNQTRNYFPDFIVGNKMYEIKPKKLWETPTVKLKKEAAENFCLKINMEYILLDIDIDSKLIYEKYLLKEIIWQGEYEQKFLDFYFKEN